MTENAAKLADDVPEFDVEEVHLPVVMQRNETYVREHFWVKCRRVIGKIPFSDDVLAAYFCAMDPATPVRVKAILLAALAYFVMPADLIPDFVAALGFTDDATVMMTAIGLVGGHVNDIHRRKARETLLQPELKDE